MDHTSILELIRAWKAFLDKKRDLIFSLAEVQSDIENVEGDISALLGEQKIAMYHKDYYYRGDFVDESTAIGMFMKEASQITVKAHSWPYRPAVPSMLRLMDFSPLGARVG